MSERRYKVAGLRFVLLAVVVVLLGWLIFTVVQHFNDQRIDRGKYQAVYLVSGQIYFGKLQNTDGDYLTLTDIYLAQSNNTDASTNGSTTVQPVNTALIKATEQVYGPEDSMAIRADQVQFWQNLRGDSKITKAIESAQKQ